MSLKKRSLLGGWVLDLGEQGITINCCVCVKLPKQKDAQLFTVLRLVEKDGQVEARLGISLDEVLLPLVDHCNSEARKREKEIDKLQTYLDRRKPRAKPQRKKKKKVASKKRLSKRPSRPARRRSTTSTDPQPSVDDKRKPKPSTSPPTFSRKKRSGAAPVPEREGYEEVALGSLAPWEREMIQQMQEEKAQGVDPEDTPQGASGVYLPPPEERKLFGARERIREERTR